MGPEVIFPRISVKLWTWLWEQSKKWKKDKAYASIFLSIHKFD